MYARLKKRNREIDDMSYACRTELIALKSKVKKMLDFELSRFIRGRVKIPENVKLSIDGHLEHAFMNVKISETWRVSIQPEPQWNWLDRGHFCVQKGDKLEISNNQEVSVSELSRFLKCIDDYGSTIWQLNDTKEEFYKCELRKSVDYWLDKYNYLLFVWNFGHIFDRRLRCLIWGYVCGKPTQA